MNSEMPRVPLVTDDELDEIVQLEFPYPVAIAYRELLQTSELDRRADLCLRTFHFGIRAISLALIIRYLKSPEPEINSIELNRKIREYLPSSRPHQWVELLQDTLRAYKGRRDRMLMPELYDLYWQPQDDVKGETPWSLLEQMAALSNDIAAGRVNRAARADELTRLLRKIMRLFLFLRTYQLWYVVSKRTDILEVDVHNGVTITRTHAYSQYILEPDFSIIKERCYYITDRRGHLLELDPLLVDPRVLHMAGMTDPDVGVFDAYFAQDPESDRDPEGILQYLLLAADIKTETQDHDLVTKFLDLYEHQLGRKEQAFASRLPLTWTNIRQGLQRYSHEQMVTAHAKYTDSVYVERVHLSQAAQEFFRSLQPAMVITGEAGVGKTSLLIRLYERVLMPREDIAVLWLDGAELNTQRTLVQHVVGILDTCVNFGMDPSRTEDAAWKALQHVANTVLRGKAVVIMIDGVNENAQPIEAFQRANEFVNSLSALPIKVVVTSRPQVWRYARQHALRPFRQAHYYSPRSVQRGMQAVLENTISEQDSLVLKRFDRDEQERAFARYVVADDLHNASLNELNPRLVLALRDPLLLRITCEVYRGRYIPADLSVEDIIPSLIERMVDDPSQTLTLIDVEDFLEEQLVPQFFQTGDLPVNRLTRNQLRTVRVGPSKTLDDLVSDKTPYSDGTSVNQQFQNLMNTGWLVRTGSALNYEIRFRYEYFYDYFCGRYMARACENSASIPVFLAEWIAKLDHAPFLWGSVRNLLIWAYQSGHEADVVRLARTAASGMHKDLLVSVFVAVHRNDPDGVARILNALLNKRTVLSYSLFAPMIALETAYELRYVSFLVQGLCHPVGELRAMTVQLVYELWANQHEAESLAVLSGSIERIRLRQPRQAAHAFEGAFSLSVLIAFADYERSGIKDSHFVEIQQLWRPVIRSARFIFGDQPRPGSRRVIRRAIMRIVAVVFMRDALNVDKAQQLVFSIADIRAYFPPDAWRRDAIRRLLPYLDGAHGHPGSLDELESICREVIEKQDMLTTLVAFAALTAMCMGQPVATMEKVISLFSSAQRVSMSGRIVNGKPLAPVLTPQLTMVGQNAPYFDLLHDGTAAHVLDQYGYLVLQYERLFGGTNQGKRRRYYWSDLAEYSCWHERLRGTPISSTMQGVLDMVCKEGNPVKVRFHLYRFAHVARCSLWRSPSVAIAGIREIITRSDRRLLPKIEVAIAESLAGVRAIDPEQVDDLLLSLPHTVLNPALRERIKSMRPRINLGYVMGDGAIVFTKALLEDVDRTLRDFVKRYIYTATSSRTIHGWMSWLALELADYVRDSVLKAPSQKGRGHHQSSA